MVGGRAAQDRFAEPDKNAHPASIDAQACVQLGTRGG
jgi:hypothetical protein